MDKNIAKLEKWNFPLPELYRMALQFYKQNSGKALHLSYEDNLKLIAFKQQASCGPFNATDAPALGVLDVIGKDRRMHWQLLGDMSREQAMEGFIDLLDTMCSAFRPYVEAVRKNRDETLKEELRRMEKEKLEKEKKEREQQELLEEGYKEEIQRRQLQDALNKQTYQQFKTYAEKHFPGNPDKQALLVHQLQQEHYHQYMQQLYIQNHNPIENLANNNTTNCCEKSTEIESGLANELSKLSMENQEQEISDKNQESTNDSDGNVVAIEAAAMWSRPDIVRFKTEISAGNADGVLTVGHGDTITVRVPTSINGKSLFCEFATDNYDIGFGIYFEWSKPISREVTVHVSDSDDDDEFPDEDYLSTNEDLEYGSLASDRDSLASNSYIKPPISVIVPIYRRECMNDVYVVSHPYPGEGVYLLKFDNSYSIWRSKTVYYRVFYES